MGAWGYESCSNDSCWDALHVGGIKNIHGVKQHEVTPCLEVISIENSDCSEEDFLGCVVWFLCHELTVEQSDLEKAKKIAESLIKDSDYLSNWRNIEERKFHLSQEIKDIEKAIKNGEKDKNCEKMDGRHHPRIAEKMVAKHIQKG